MTYILPNQELSWLYKITSIIEEDRGSLEDVKCLFPGGTYYAWVFKGMYPDSKVDVVEIDKDAAIFQSFAAWNVKRNGVEKTQGDLFITKKRFGKKYRILREINESDFDDIRGDYKEFASNSKYFNYDEVESSLNNAFSPAKSSKKIKITQNPFGLDNYTFEVLEQTKITEEPDKILIKDFMELESKEEYDIIISNNVCEHVDKNFRKRRRNKFTKLLKDLELYEYFLENHPFFEKSYKLLSSPGYLEISVFGNCYEGKEIPKIAKNIGFEIINKEKKRLGLVASRLPLIYGKNVYVLKKE